LDRRLIWAALALANAFALYLQWSKGGWLYHGDGSVYAHDFISFWAAGQRVLAGSAALVYDTPAQIAFQTGLIHAPKPVDYGFYYPPHFLFTTIPFARLDLVPAFLTFLGVTGLLYALALRLVSRDWSEAVLAALAGGGAYISMLWVQNGFLTGALLIAGLALLPTRPAIAGILFGLLTMKPQLGLLIPLALAAGGYWRTIGWAAGAFLALVLVAELAFGPGIWSAFLQSGTHTSGFLEAGSLWPKMQTPFALTLRLLGSAGAYAIQALFALLAAWIVFKTWRNPAMSHWLKCAALIAASMLVPPYLFAYDAVPLTAAALMLFRDNPNLPVPDRIAAFAACLLPGFTDYLLSAAVPIASAIMLVLVLRQAERGEKPDRQTI
jgi:hypothetical protein